MLPECLVQRIRLNLINMIQRAFDDHLAICVLHGAKGKTLVKI